MARTKSMDDEESFEIEVLRNINQLHASSTLLGANNTASSTHDLSLTCRDSYRKAANLNPGRGRGSGELRNGCCHSTPVQRSASNNIPLKEYFSKLSLPVTPIEPCAGSETRFEQDATNRPVGKTLLELTTTYQSTMDRLLDFDEIGFEASDPGLTSGFADLFNLDDSRPSEAPNSATTKKSTPNKTTNTDPDAPVCILLELSKKRPKGVPEDILTKLHTYPNSKKRGQQR